MEICPDFSSWDNGTFEPCRTCGTFYCTEDDLIKPIFFPTTTGDANFDVSMAEILQQMTDWNLMIQKEDGRSQYMCTSCIAEFQRLLKFKQSCLETHEHWVEQQQNPGINIKEEPDSKPKEKFCAFVYLDSDNEVSDEDGSQRVSAAFDIQHVPIKAEHMARVPAQQTEMKFVPPEPQPELAPVAVKTEADHEFILKTATKEKDPDTDGMCSENETKHDPNATSISFDDSIPYENDESDEEVVKFTYDDDEDATTIPQPTQSASVICKICSHEFPNQKLHQAHMQNMHLSKDWECHLCGKKFLNSKESRLKLHMKFHKLQRRLKCPICGFFSNTKEILKQHKRLVHSRTVCQYCGKIMKPHILQSHMMKHKHERESLCAQSRSSSDHNLMPVTPFAPDHKNLNVDNHLRLPSTSSVLQSLNQPYTSSATQEYALKQTLALFSPMPSPENKRKYGELSNISPNPRNSPVQQQQQLPPEVLSVNSSPIHQQEQEPTTEESLPVAYSPIMPICVIQCAFCSDSFEEAQQLQDHVLAKHENMMSPSQKVKAPPQLHSISMAMDVDMDTESDSSPQKSSSWSENQNSNSRSYSSSNNNSFDKSIFKCHICGKPFDLKIKLNRHLKQHKKAPF
ncbi:zinc finger protein 473 homolog [Drosophila pseudoobscura]|uniref:Zinc finger protein 473 homolog n=1 Tax=Drosophila pseudoobscura pseudoobscura TaxID=46245 RepID=A0A6I8URN5_DROPS|nr:zinc finger protein 473 homolog [Drosophila pseudoobscura]